MRILTIHSDFIEFEAKQKAIKDAEEVKKEKERYEECLVVFTSVEGRDENAPDEVADKTAEEIKKVAKEVKVNRIVVYPYVHLTNSPSSPAVARRVLARIQNQLREAKYEVHHAPFGWYKAFDLKAKGHPLSELSREIIAEPKGTSKTEDIISGALKEEEKVKSEWLIMTPDAELLTADKFNFKGHKNLEKFYKYEVSKIRGVSGEPPHAKLMKELELVGYEEGTDPGNLKYYPKGRLIKSLLEQWVTQKVIEYGAMEVETPIMYDFGHPALESYLQRFPARQYVVESAKKKFFLRFAACFGQFLEAAKANISYRNLPLKLYELTRYSFRLEKAGELVALRRLRAFTMPDMHTMCKDIEGSKEEFISQFDLCVECMEDLGFTKNDYEMAIRFTKEFWDKNQQWIEQLVKKFGKPVLIERWDRRFAYFDPKFEFNFVDSMDKAAALSTVQIDHENAKRFEIEYTDSDNSRKNPYILHCSPSGAIERCLYALLERAHMDSKKGKAPMLPTWLSPTQVRICPVNDDYLGDCNKLANELEAAHIRVDINDRPESIGKKIRDAELEWTSYIIVYGAKEKESNSLNVRNRESGKVESTSLADLIKTVKEKGFGKPFKPLTLPRHLSKRPIFVSRK